MASIEEHEKTVREMEDDINQKIREGVVLERQKIIGFASSEGAINCFAILLHRKNLIPHGFNVNHRWFGSEKLVNGKFPFMFPQKTKLVPKLIRLEELRDRLCYGKRKPLTEAEEAIRLFFDIKKIISDEMGVVL
ncbi:MAG: hypothetical protein V1870_00910 [Candidatus Aenigmatarchaeota archaeon]